MEKSNIWALMNTDRNGENAKRTWEGIYLIICIIIYSEDRQTTKVVMNYR